MLVSLFAGRPTQLAQVDNKNNSILMRNSQILRVLAAIYSTMDRGAHIHGLRELRQSPILIHRVGAQRAIDDCIARVVGAIECARRRIERKPTRGIATCFQGRSDRKRVSAIKRERVDVAVIVSGIEVRGSCQGDKERKIAKHGGIGNGGRRKDIERGVTGLRKQ